MNYKWNICSTYSYIGLNKTYCVILLMSCDNVLFQQKYIKHKKKASPLEKRVKNLLECMTTTLFKDIPVIIYLFIFFTFFARQTF